MCHGVSFLLDVTKPWAGLTSRAPLFRPCVSCCCVGAAFLPRVKVLLALHCRILFGRVRRTRALRVTVGWLGARCGGGLPDTPDAEVLGLRLLMRLLDSASFCCETKYHVSKT